MNIGAVKKLTKRKRIVIGAALALFAAVFVAALIVFPFLRIRFFGITLTPSEDIPLRETAYYLQNDAQWRGDLIGDSNRTVGSQGCLISCAAMAATELEGRRITPQEFNAAMTGVGGYDTASLLWYKINEAFPTLDYSYSRTFSSKTIEADLKNGLLPIVKIKLYGGVVDHWVIVIGAKDGEFYIADPLNGEKNPLPLSTYGRVYSYRVIIKS